MQESKEDINKIVEGFIKAKCFSQDEQEALSSLFVKEGLSEALLQKIEEFFAPALKREFQKLKPVFESYKGQIESAKQTMDKQKAALAENMQNELSKLSDFDFSQKSALFERYNQAVADQQEDFEREIKEIGAKAMLEVAYLNADN